MQYFYFCVSLGEKVAHDDDCFMLHSNGCVFSTLGWMVTSSHQMSHSK